MVVDPSSTALGEAHEDGLAVVTGDATRREVLRRAGVGPGQQVIITTDRDDSTVLATLNVAPAQPRRLRRRRGPRVRQRAAGAAERRGLGRHLLRRRRPADRPVVAQPDARRGDGGPAVLRRGPRGRRARPAGAEVGKQPQQLPDQVIAVVRDEKVHRYFDPAVTQLARGDRLVVVRPARSCPGRRARAPTASGPRWTRTTEPDRPGLPQAVSESACSWLS